MKIQTYQPNQVETQIARQPALRTPQVADTASIIGRGLNQLGGALQETKKQFDDAAAEEALINFEKDKNNLFFNPDDGYFNKQGRDAYDGAKSTTEALASLQSKYADAFDSTAARETFMRSSQVHLNRANTSIMQHSSRGLNDYESATIAARVENSIESASLYFNDDNELQLQNTIGRDSIREQAEREGVGEDVVAERLQTYESKFVASSIDAAISQGDLGRANELMGRFGDRLEPKEASIVAKNLNKANFTVDTQSAAQQILGDGHRPLSSMIDEVNGMPSTTPEEVEMKSEVMRLVNNQYKVQKSVRDEAKREIYENYGKQVQDGDISVGDIPGFAWDNMTVKQRSAIKRIEKVKAEGANIVSDSALYVDLMSRDDADLAKLDPTEYYDKLDKGDYGRLEKAVIDARKGGSSSGESASVRARSSSVSATLQQILGKKTSKFNDDDRERSNAFHRVINQAVSQEEEALGRKLKPTEFDTLLNAQTRKVVIDNSFGPIPLPNSEHGFASVPVELVDEITQSLVRRGVPITGDNIARLYLKGKEEGVFE